MTQIEFAIGDEMPFEIRRQTTVIGHGVRAEVEPRLIGGEIATPIGAICIRVAWIAHNRIGIGGLAEVIVEIVEHIELDVATESDIGLGARNIDGRPMIPRRAYTARFAGDNGLSCFDDVKGVSGSGRHGRHA